MTGWNLRARVHNMRCHAALVVVVVMATLSMTSSACPSSCACRQLRESGGGTAVDCRGRGLTAIVTDIPSDAVELDLGLNPIRNLTRSSFSSTMTKLRRLSMDGCLLERLDWYSFKDLQLLRSLDLSGNRIGDVSDGAFQGLHQLRELNLSGNDVRSLPVFFLRGLNLDELRLTGNGLRELPDDLFKFATIKSLNLDRNAFAGLSRSSFHHLRQSMTSLSVSDNSVPLTIADDTFHSINLTRLSFVSSRLQGVAFLSQTSATTIDLSGNTLTSVVISPSEILAKSCRQLRLSGVSLESLDDSLASSIRSVIDLDLSGNRLTVVKPDLFRFAPDLTNLDLSRNRLSRVSDELLNHLQNLETLNLSRSGVASIGWDGIRQMTRLINLDLSGNLLQVIPENASGILDSISAVNLSGNPWHCNCEMRWFREWLAETTKPIGGGALRCSSPRSQLMLNLVPGDFVCTSPQITAITTSKNVDEGSNVLLSCASQSDPAPSIVWKAPFGDVLSITPPEDRVRTKTIADWAIHRIKPYQSGWYSCNATNVLRSNVTYTYLHVKTSAADQLDMNGVSFPAIPSKLTPISAPAMTTAAAAQAESTSRSPPGRSTVSDEDEVDGPLPSETWQNDDRTPAVSGPLSSSSASTFNLSETAANDADRSSTAAVSKDLIVILVVTVVGLILAAAVVVAVVVVVYRRRSTRKYPVNPPDCEARDISETTKLQLNNLDDSCYCSSAASDPMNPAKRRS